MAANLNFAEKLKPALDEITMAESKLWGVLDHSKTDFSGNDTVRFSREGIVPMFDLRQNGTAPADVNGRIVGQQILHRDADSNTFYNQDEFNAYTSYVPMRQFTKTLSQEKIWEGRFNDTQPLLTGLTNEIASFTARQVAKVVVPNYDKYAMGVIKSNVPTENTFTCDLATGNLYEVFAAMNDKIKNAEYTDPSGIVLPQQGSGRKIALVTSTFLKRLIHDMPAAGSLATESQVKLLVNGWVGGLLGWDFIECHEYYMPYVSGDSGPKVQFIGFDPETVVAPLITDEVSKDTSKVRAFATFIHGHHLYDCFINNDETRPAGWLDREQLLATIAFTGSERRRPLTAVTETVA